jgi:hypothetical protein
MNDYVSKPIRPAALAAALAVAPAREPDSSLAVSSGVPATPPPTGGPDA